MKNLRIVLVTGILVLLANILPAQTVDLVNYNFATNCAAPPAGWRIENVDGSCTWRCVGNGGISQENHTSLGCTGVANDWLITPVLLLNNYRNEVLSFTSSNMYVGGGVALKYSTNYPGTGNPGLYTWTTLMSAITAGPSGNISLSGIVGDSVYVAFHYTSIGNGNSQASRWVIIDALVRGEQSVTLANPSHRNITSSSAILGAELTNDGGLAITERGVLWSTSPNPTLTTPNTTKVPRQGGLGVYDTTASGLPTGTLIYYRGYARTAGLDFYSPVSSFYTLADEPTQHTTSFTATSLGNNAIVLKWNQVASAKGYLILQKIGSDPSALPLDATAYPEGSFLNDATIARVINVNTIETDTIKNLLSGTRYYYTLIPFGTNVAANAGAYNYLTAPIIPSANDSTIGAPTSYFSDITGVTNSENDFISSIENTTSINVSTEGTQVWKLALRDGGALMNDADALPTIYTEFMITSGSFNTATWQTMIQSVALFDDSTGNKIGTATVSAGGIKFTGLNLVAADNNFKTISIRLSLNKAVALPEQTAFQFAVIDTTVKTQSPIFSSQKGSFIAQSLATKNKIRVSASRIRIITQPPSLVEAGTIVSNVTTELVDVWNNPDIDTVITVQATSTWNNLANGSSSVPVVTGRAVFNQLVFNRATGADTILFEAGTLIPVKSIRVKVKNSSLSDVVATPGFVYARSIPYINYLDSANLTVANTFPVFGFTIRDGATQMNDADSASTLITAIKLSITNFNQIRTLALFDSSDNWLAEVPVTMADAEFTNLNIITADNGSNKLKVRATFKKVVTDESRLQFKITLITYKNDTLSSQLVAADGGGAQSSTASFENKINVIADKFELTQQPGLSYANETIYPVAKLRATDSLGNTDMEGRIISVQALSGTLNSSSITQVALSPASGYAEFSKIAYADTITATQLKFTDGILTALTNAFDVINPTWYKSVKSGNWDTLNTWEYSTDKGLTWLDSPTVIPNATTHGKITIGTGHTVTIGGGTTETFKIDETIVEAGAVLITPILPGKTLEVMNGRDEDLIIYGTLKHTNGTSVNGIINQAGSNVTVMPGGIIELAANGYAANWAANPLIIFKNNAVYYHHTTQTNAIAAGTYFASTPSTEIPIFRFGSAYNFRSLTAQQLIINGVTAIDPFVTVTFSGSGSHTFRNGFSGDGNITFAENCLNTITGNATISGDGIIRINDNAKFEFGESSVVAVTGNKTIHTNNNKRLTIAGYFNSNAYTINGSSGVELTNNAWIVTAHAQGVKGTLSGTVLPVIGQNITVELNATNHQQEILLPASTSIAKLIVTNPYGVLLTDLLHVNKSLDLSGGSIITSGNGALSLTETTTLINYNANRFINGKVRVNMNEQVFLPIGKKQVYAPVTIKNKQNDSSIYEIEYFDTLQTIASIGSLKSISSKDSWIVSRLKGQTAAKFTFTHHALPGAGENLSDLRVGSIINNIYEAVGPLNRNATQTTIETDYTEPTGIFAIAIDQPCIVPASPVVINDTICYGTTATLSASSSSPLVWYASANDETSIANGNNILLTAPLFSDTSFYVESRQLSCASNRVKFHVAVVNALTKPTVTSNSIQVCKNNPATLTASGSQLLWFADAQLTTNLTSGNSFVSGPITNDTIFYVASSRSGCLSTAGQITVFVKANPVKPFATDVTACKGSTAILSASTNASTINWYASLTDLIPFNTNNNFSVSVNKDTAFYAEAVEGLCKSERAKVDLLVAKVPATPVITDLGVACKGSAVTLNVNVTTDARWFLSDADSLPVHVGTSYTTEILDRNTLFFVDASNGICKSAKLSFPVTVVSTPVVSGIRAVKIVSQYDSIAVTTESNKADEYKWSFGNDAQPSVAVGAGPHYVKWTSSGDHTIHLSVSNKLGTFSCSKEFDTTIYVVPSTGIREYTNSITSNIYPNPANTLLNINATFKSAESVTVYLMDALGKIVWNDQTSELSKNYSKQVDVHMLSDAVYMLCIEAGGLRRTQKVVISK
jgi:hypothetical protein